MFNSDDLVLCISYGLTLNRIIYKAINHGINHGRCNKIMYIPF